MSETKRQAKETMEEWRKIPLDTRMGYYNEIFPKGTSLELKNRFLYGRYALNEVEQFEKWLREQTVLPIKVAEELYKQIGIFNKKIKIPYKTNKKAVFEVNKKWRVVFYYKTQRFFIYDKTVETGDKRTLWLAKELAIPLKMARITEPLNDDEQALKVLKRLKDFKENPKLKEELREFLKELNKSEDLARSQYHMICKEFSKIFGEKVFSKFDLAKENFIALAKYLTESK